MNKGDRSKLKGAQLPTAFFTVSLPPHVASLGALGQHCGWAALWSAALGFSSWSGDAGPGQEHKDLLTPDPVLPPGLR